MPLNSPIGVFEDTSFENSILFKSLAVIQRKMALETWNYQFIKQIISIIIIYKLLSQSCKNLFYSAEVYLTFWRSFLHL